ncbi:MAG: HDIG domain-containing protein [Phycisphaerae bacterium]|nr:HDIG domain-containing protein [Phycisphaerae bacterium]
MFWFGKKRSDRRSKAQRVRAESSKPLWEQFQERVGVWSAVATLAFFLGATVIALYGKSSLGYRVGDAITGPINARVSFSRIDEKQTQRARKAAKEATPSYYRVNVELIARIGGELQNLHLDAKGADSYDTFASIATDKGWKVTAATFNELQRLSDEAGGKFYAGYLSALKGRLQDEYTVRPTVEEDRQPASNSAVARVLPVRPTADGVEPEQGPGEPLEISTVQLIPISNPSIIEGQAERLATLTFPSPLRSAVSEIVRRRLADEPILLFDTAATRAAMDAVFAAIEDVVIRYKKGSPLISPSPGEERLSLNQEHIQLLQCEHAAYLWVLSDKAGTGEGQSLREQRLMARAGITILMALLSFALFAYVHQYQPRVLEVHSRTIAFGVLLLAVLASSKFINARFDYRELAIGPMLLAAAILIIAYQRRFASGVCTIVSVLVVVTVRGDIDLLVLLAAGSTVVTLTLVNIRTRTILVISGAMTAAAVASVCLAYGLIQGHQTEFIVQRAGVAGVTAMGAALIIQASLPFIERAFKIATPLTLQEWGDATKPLLQRLAHDAPGTYNHSLVLATMAGAACEAIGADALLARVGALYHDVGKILKKDYFAENQEASINRHDNLSPTMSLLIIVGHVKDGIEMAKEYGLPRILHQFIAEHHGTTVVRYFHHAASEKQPQIATGKHDRMVPDSEFRYPGPKPHSKESAILMLCDGVEGAVRALPEPTPGRIENLVHAVLMDRLNDGQFDDCEVTLRQLHRVEESLVKSLCKFYHGRVAYPKTATKQDKSEANHADDQGNQQARSAG